MMIALEGVSESLVGAIVDTRYELRRLVAHGGMGLVFEAYHRFTRQIVALKLLHDACRQLKEARARLLREAHALAIVRHPGFVEVLDAGVCGEHGPYLVLEMLEGRTLDGILASRRRLSVAETVHVGAHVCDTLAYAHGRGIVHRDLKPSNVFVARNEIGREKIKLIDLGVAAMGTGQHGPFDRKLTTAHEVLGTPEYMAPEQLWGREVDERTDVYATGMTLYECLTGEVPYGGAYPDVVVQVSNARSPPRVRDRRPETPAGLATVIEHALEKDPGARFQSILELGRAIVAASYSPVDPVHLLSAPPEDVPESGDRAGDEPEQAEQAIKLVRRKVPRSGAGAPPSGGAASRPERRQRPRAPYVTPVLLLRPNAEAVEARSEEIGVEGMLVLSPQSFSVGMTLDLRFAVPTTGEMVVVAGSIRWTREGRGKAALGVEFGALPAGLSQIVIDYIASEKTAHPPVEG
jgi:serine/threonine protein kinase